LSSLSSHPLPLSLPPSFPTRRSSDLCDGLGGHDLAAVHHAAAAHRQDQVDVMLTGQLCPLPHLGVGGVGHDAGELGDGFAGGLQDRKSTRLNSSHASNSYAVFCLKKQ